MYKPNKKEQSTLENITSKYYMLPTLELINKKIINKNDKKTAWKKAFNNLHDFMRGSEDNVKRLLEKRKQKGEISDIRQATVSIVGSMFSNLIIYIFIKNKIYKNIKSDIYITSKPSEVKNFKEITTIKIGKETQKPDVDLIIYNEKKMEILKIVLFFH